MRKVLVALFGLVVLCVVGVVAVFALPADFGGPAGELARGAKASVANLALDAADVKGRVKSALDENREAISQATGLSPEEVDAAVEELDIDGWQATPLPADARKTGEVEGTYAGIDGTVTTYEDPGYVTLEAYGQTVTLAVPESAQKYIAYLQAL